MCFLALVGSAINLPSLCAQPAQQTALRELNLRVTCAALQPSFWQVRVAIVDDTQPRSDSSSSGPTLSQIVNRSESIAATGAFHISEDARSLTFVPRQSLPGGEFDFRFKGQAGTQLNVQVVASVEHQPRPTTPDDPAWSNVPSKLISVDQLSAGQATTYPPAADVNANAANDVTWSIRRTNEDHVRIQGTDGMPFGEVGGEFSFSARVNAMTSQASSRLDLVYRLRQASTGKVVSEKQWPVDVDEEGNTTEIKVSEPCPNVDGVYEISCHLEKEDESLLRRLRGKGTIVAMAWHPFVVTSPATADRANPAGNPPWQTVATIQPANKPEWELNQWLPSSSQKLIRRIDPREPSNLRRSEHGGQPVSVLPPNESYVASLPSQNAGQPHKIAIRYPAGEYTRVRVEVDTSEDFQNPERMFLIAEDQRPDPIGPWQTYTFVHYPAAGNEFIRLTNVSTELDAHFVSISVTAGPPQLVSASIPSADTRLATLRMDGFDWVDRLTSDVARHESQGKITTQTAALHRLYVGSQRLLDYVNAVGMNSVLIQASQGERVWFDSTAFHAGRKVNPWEGYHLEILLRLADQSSIRAFIGLDPSMQLTDVESSIAQQEDPASWLRRTSKAVVYNGLNPSVRSQLRQLCEQLQSQVQHHKSFAGLAINCRQANHLAPLSDRHLHPTEIQLFAKSAGKSDMTSAQFVAWIQSDGREAMSNWVQMRSHQVYQDVTKNLDGKTLMLVDNDQAVDRVNGRTGPQLVVDLRRSSFESLDSEAPEAAGTTNVDRRFAVVSLGDRANDPRQVTTFMKPSSIRKMSEVIVKYDPQILLIDDSASTLAMSPAVSRMVRGFTSIPNVPLIDLVGTDAAAKTVHVRYARKNGKVVLVVNNVAPWSSDLRCDLTTVQNWSELSSSSVADGTDESEEWKIEDRSLNATLNAGGMLVLSAPDSTTTQPVRLWTSRVSGGAQAMTDIKEKVTAVVERIGVLSNPEPYDALSNGGFEKPGGVGIPGWMHTQYPPNAVRLDSSEAIEGNQSVLLSNDEKNTNRAWLVSETITPPASGRLAVSLACRGELVEGDAAHRLRVSIEGTRDGQPFRQAAEFDVVQDGHWQPRRVVLEASDVDPTKVESIRLTIDSLSAGRVWIDEVRLHDWFPTTSERGELQGEAFLAVQGLQRGNVTPAARLLHNYWAQYLIRQKDVREMPPVLQATQEEEEPSGMADRIKSWLPRPLRF